MSLAILALLLFVSVFLLVLYGYPVAFTLGGLSLVYAFCFSRPQRAYPAAQPGDGGDG